jgi:hypothetical protein
MVNAAIAFGQKDDIMVVVIERESAAVAAAAGQTEWSPKWARHLDRLQVEVSAYH